TRIENYSRTRRRHSELSTHLYRNTRRLSMANDLEAKVTSIIVEKLGVEESDVTRDASFTNDLGADSLDTVELIMEFEKEFDITIPDEDAERMRTAGDAIDYLQQKTSELVPPARSTPGSGILPFCRNPTPPCRADEESSLPEWVRSPPWV